MVRGPTYWPISAVLIPAGSNGGEKTDQPNIVIFVANARINITRLTFQNYLTLHEHCIQEMFTGSHLGKKISVKLQLQTSVPQRYDALRFQTMEEKAELQRISLCYVLFLVLSTRTDSLTNVHFPLYFTLHLHLMKMYLKHIMDVDWLWRFLLPINQISPFGIVFI